ncbi:hypothetical protein TKK_0012829 [Trichogramma kaykai]|uniref:Cytochrome P450 n=1 Tax=Trichogramma kaykai TaxID=54128 RepID=A0ABD2WLH6_9HYME
MLLVILVIILILFYAFHYFFYGGRNGRLLAKIPGPTVWPIIGCAPKIMVPTDKFMGVVQQMDKQYYPMYKILILNLHVVTILSVDYAEVIFTSKYTTEKSIFYKLLDPWFGTGLLTSGGEKWQKRRKMLTPAFHLNVLQKYFEIFVENTIDIVENLKTQGVSIQNLLPLCTKYSLDNIIEAAMGTSLCDDKSGQAYRHAIREMADTLCRRFISPWLFNDWIFSMTQSGRKQKKLVDTIHEFSKKVINERKEYHERTKGYYLNDFESKQGFDDSEALGYNKKRLAMLDLLIAAQKNGNQIDDAGIQEEVDTFMLAGHDTSALALFFGLLFIAEHKDVQVKIRNEIKEVFGSNINNIKLMDLQKLNYLERCIKETLRFFPSVPYISRVLAGDIKLDDFTIPKGTLTDIHIITIHRDPKHWPDPEKFDPDRFLPEQIRKRNPYAYLPFSSGARSCIGMKFAMTEMKIFLVYILTNFQVEIVDYLAQQIPFIPDITLRPGVPVNLKFVPLSHEIH